MALKKSISSLLLLLSVACGGRAQGRDQSYFRVLITGFTCNRQTSDDPLQRDGVDDEVQLYADTYELTPSRDEFAQPLGFYLCGRSVQSAVIGDTNNHAGRIQAAQVTTSSAATESIRHAAGTDGGVRRSHCDQRGAALRRTQK